MLALNNINYKASIISILIMLALKNINYKARIIGILIMLKVRQNPNDSSSRRFLQETNVQIQFYYYDTCFCSFFWRKLKTQKRHFEINLPLALKNINYKASIIGILIMLALNNINYKASIICIFTT